MLSEFALYWDMIESTEINPEVTRLIPFFNFTHWINKEENYIRCFIFIDKKPASANFNLLGSQLVWF